MCWRSSVQASVKVIKFDGTSQKLAPSSILTSSSISNLAAFTRQSQNGPQALLANIAVPALPNLELEVSGPGPSRYGKAVGTEPFAPGAFSPCGGCGRSTASLTWEGPAVPTR